jgi:hypothetical protein
VEDPRILSINEQGDENMKNTENEWMKLMMLVMEFFQLQNELTKLKIEEFNEWEPPELDCHECFARAVEDAAQMAEETVQGEHEFDEAFREAWE